MVDDVGDVPGVDVCAKRCRATSAPAAVPSPRSPRRSCPGMSLATLRLVRAVKRARRLAAWRWQWLAALMSASPRYRCGVTQWPSLATAARSGAARAVRYRLAPLALDDEGVAGAYEALGAGVREPTHPRTSAGLRAADEPGRFAVSHRGLTSERGVKRHALRLHAEPRVAVGDSREGPLSAAV